MLEDIIDEDDLAMRLIIKKVLEEIPEIRLIEEVDNGKEFSKKAETIKSDIVFVDIDSQQNTDVEATKEIIDINPMTFFIFATAFDKFSHEAIQVYAFEYLVKPSNIHRIRQIVDRIKDLLKKGEKSSLFLGHNDAQKGNDTSKLFIQCNDRYKIINIKDILIITRISRQTIIYTINDKILTYEPLHKFEERLKKKNFFRSHRGFIINTELVTEIFPWGEKTFLVKFAHTSETALMTFEKAKEFRKNYCSI